MRWSVALIGLAMSGSATAGSADVDRARMAIAFVNVAPTLCKSLRAAPGAMAAIVKNLTIEDTTDVVTYKTNLNLVTKNVRDLMEAGDEANACKMARDFESKFGAHLFDAK